MRHYLGRVPLPGEPWRWRQTKAGGGPRRSTAPLSSQTGDLWRITHADLQMDRVVWFGHLAGASL